ncbi:hypothetical protein PENTCL1PPCAC_11129 [Pristionchus entomophagus]|uniref:BLOC-1-related complex subunit 5 n=1 Tax=Pristionchus entomophagus TaxID=358040 RepID=A0AAV5T150_9BILA|nr:hypothetical protein PENTCL1PPCAC_11129 [Pristionchus entomophagus]
MNRNYWIAGMGDLSLEDDSERARERARLQITPRFDQDMDIVSLLVEATEISIENREVGLPACGPYESVLKTMGEDGKRMEEERDRLKDKIVNYETRVNEVSHQIAALIHESSCSLSDIRRLNPFDCLQRLEETVGALLHQNTTKKTLSDSFSRISVDDDLVWMNHMQQ